MKGVLTMSRKFDNGYVYFTTPEQTKSHAAEILEDLPDVIGVDTETTGLNCLRDKLRLVQVAVKGKPVYIFDMDKIGADGVKALDDVLTGSAVKIFHNGKFDLKYLHIAGIIINNKVFDTMLVEQVIMSGSVFSGFSLKDIAMKYTGITLDKEYQKDNWNPPLTTEQLRYAALDAKILLDIYECQMNELKCLNLLETAKLENKALIPTCKMELAGFKIDKKAVRDLKVDIAEVRAELLEELRELLSAVDNYNSPAQVQKALRAIGLDITSTEKDTLIKYRDDYPAVDKLLQFKKITKQISLLESLVKAINPHTGRIHANYKQNSTATGRYSCTEPNLQGVPNTKGFRRCFAAEEGNRLVIADYSQIELRIIAEFADDETMIQIFNDDEDIHKITASMVNKKPVDEVTPQERQSAKAMNFGLIYGMGYKSFQKYAKSNYGVDLTDYETKSAVDKFFMTYKGIGRRLTMLDSLFTREERTLGNRRRLWNTRPIITERANAAIQGTGADILKQALVNVNKRLLCLDSGIKLVGTVHDEIILECPKDRAKRVSKELKEAMEDAGRKYLKKVPVVADVSIGNNWGDK
jgi:DNA polymerase I-like protein with 3'-5' exonuclease and polymerase domains